MSDKTLSPLLEVAGSAAWKKWEGFLRTGGVFRVRDEAHAIAARLQQYVKWHLQWTFAESRDFVFLALDLRSGII